MVGIKFLNNIKLSTLPCVYSFISNYLLNVSNVLLNTSGLFNIVKRTYLENNIKIIHFSDFILLKNSAARFCFVTKDIC